MLKIKINSIYLFILMWPNFTVFVSVLSKYEHISEWSNNKYNGELNLICGESNKERMIFNGVSLNSIGIYYQSDIIAIAFENCRFQKIDIDFFKEFNNLLSFNISNVELETLQANTLRNAKKLITLIASNNQNAEIPTQLLINSSHIKYVDLSNNTIERIAPLAFDGANYLQTLNLSHNKIAALRMREFAIPNLLTLDLSHNNLTTLNEYVFEELIKLKHLHLSFNPIGNLKVETFACLTHLETVSLKHTKLSQIQLGTFSQQDHLMTLDLSENELLELDFKLFFPIFRHLQSLNLSRNQITILTGFQNKMFPQLTLLNINHNKFNCGYLQSFMESVNWEKLHLQIDRRLNNAQTENIHGIDCIATNTSDTSNINSTLTTGILDKLLSIHITKTITELNNSTEILSKSIQKLRNDIFLIKISLMTCICVITVILLLAFLKRNRLINLIKCRQLDHRYNTLSDRIIKYSNEQIRVE